MALTSHVYPCSARLQEQLKIERDVLRMVGDMEAECLAHHKATIGAMASVP